jgi:hypothetical protein
MPLTKYPDSSRPYQLGLELRTGADPDKDSPGRNAINDATTQVLRASSGLINYVLNSGNGTVLSDISPSAQQSQLALSFLPVIFTTAEIWTTEADISAADLRTGNLENVECEQKDWIWFNHNRSARLRHDLDWSPPKDLRDAIMAEFTRSVAVVTPKGIESFFKLNFTHWLFDD